METIARWMEGLRFEAAVSTGQKIPMDSSPEHGGTNAGARPVELLLAALAGCTGMDVIAILVKKRQDVTGFQVRVEGERRDEHPRVYTKLHVVYEVTGRRISREAVQQAVALSEEKYCSVAAMLRNTTPITTEIRVLEAKP